MKSLNHSQNNIQNTEFKVFTYLFIVFSLTKLNFSLLSDNLNIFVNLTFIK